MKKIIVFSENTDIAEILLTYAAGLSGDVEAVAVGAKAAEKLAAYCPGTVFALPEAERPEGYAKGIAAWLNGRGADLFLVGSTAVGRELAASAAGYADAAMISDATCIEPDGEEFRVSLTIHGGLISREERTGGLTVITLPRGISQAEKRPKSGSVESLSLTADGRVFRVSQEAIPKAGVNLGEAKRIVSIGMGCDEPDVAAARELAELMGGELACSRSLAEQRHWLPLDRYVGISGAAVAPDLYFTLGISGQIQHVFGARDSKIIAAINTDENAPIFGVADYGIVGDIHTFMPLLAEELKKAGK